MPNDKAAPKELKVTDKRIFTPEGEIREEFKQDIRPGSPAPETAAPAAPAEPAENRVGSAEQRPEPSRELPKPSPYFTALINLLAEQAAMFLGMAPKGYPGQPKPNPAAAREWIDMLSALHEKTEGNLTAEEAEFLKSAISELKLAYVQQTKKI